MLIHYFDPNLFSRLLSIVLCTNRTSNLYLDLEQEIFFKFLSFCNENQLMGTILYAVSYTQNQKSDVANNTVF